MKFIFNLSRILVGSLFIVSGLIKANDTMGFGYKLEEYFEQGVLNMPFFIPYATGIAAFICIVEIVLGVATLLGGKMKITAWSLLLLNTFFTFLTFYSAYFNKVTDCGCFGDAIKLTPWQSFTKDIILMIPVLIIFIFRNRISFNTKQEDKVILPISVFIVAAFSIIQLNWNFPWIFTIVVLGICLFIKYILRKDKPSEWFIALFTAIISLGFCIYTYGHLPIKDFRPYRIGTDIQKAMEMPEGAPRDEYKTVLFYEKNGVVKEFTSQNYPWDDSTWVWKDTKSILIKKGYTPPIHDFRISDTDGNDRTQEILSEPGYKFMVISHNINDINIKVQDKVNAFAEKCNNSKIKFFGLSGGTVQQTDVFRHEVNAMYDYYFVDQTALKTIIRSNPGLVLLKGSTVVNMWHYNDFPTFEEVKAKYKF